MVENTQSSMQAIPDPCILVLKKNWKCRQFQIFLAFRDFVLDNAILRILGGL